MKDRITARNVLREELLVSLKKKFAKHAGSVDSKFGKQDPETAKAFFYLGCSVAFTSLLLVSEMVEIRDLAKKEILKLINKGFPKMFALDKLVTSVLNSINKFSPVEAERNVIYADLIQHFADQMGASYKEKFQELSEEPGCIWFLDEIEKGEIE